MQDIGRDQEGDEELSREQWIGRGRAAPSDVWTTCSIRSAATPMGDDLWSTYGGVDPRSFADAEYRDGSAQVRQVDDSISIERSGHDWTAQRSSTLVLGRCRSHILFLVAKGDVSRMAMTNLNASKRLVASPKRSLEQLPGGVFNAWRLVRSRGFSRAGDSDASMVGIGSSETAASANTTMPPLPQSDQDRHQD